MRDEEGLLISNWDVPHDWNGSWHVGIEVGRRHFAEVAELAAHDEQEAFGAIECALLKFQSGGWGIETGFAIEVARAAVVGLRALRDGSQQIYSHAALESLLAVGQHMEASGVK